MISGFLGRWINVDRWVVLNHDAVNFWTWLIFTCKKGSHIVEKMESAENNVIEKKSFSKNWLQATQYDFLGKFGA